MEQLTQERAHLEALWVILNKIGACEGLKLEGYEKQVTEYWKEYELLYVQHSTAVVSRWGKL